MLGWVIAQAERARSLGEVVVVLGRAADEIRERVDFRNAKVVDNPVFTQGCSSSYRAGIGAVDPRAAAVMIILGDQPGVTPEIIDGVAEHWRQGDKQIVLASYQGRLGHPMLFAKPMFDKLTVLHGDKAAWKLVDANPDLLSEVPFDRPFPEDIDTEEDFKRVAAQDERQP